MTGDADASTVVSVFCLNCGHENPGRVNYCSSCGTAMATLTQETSLSVPPVASIEDGEPTPVATTADLASGDAVLVVTRGSGEGTRISLDAPVVVAGRHPDSAVFLDDVTVSRSHAEFSQSSGGTSIRDLGSLNGTYVNRQRIEQVALNSGDEVQIGKFKLLYLRG